jgi:hypothetical protein
MKNKNKFLILIGLLCYTITYILISHILTVGKMNSLRELDGMSISRDSLNRRLHKSYSELKNKGEISKFSNFMNIAVPENTVLYKISGKGLPYFYAAVIIDTLNNKVINVTLKELQ